MTDSQIGLTLRQRGIGIAGAGLLLQLIGVAAGVAVADDWLLYGVALVISAGASLLSFTSVKDRTKASGIAGLVTLGLAVLEAMGFGATWGGVLVVAIGTALLLFGNKQLAAGITA